MVNQKKIIILQDKNNQEKDLYWLISTQKKDKRKVPL
jgi:hypothetical protein